jgi:hypothetical protein
LHLLLRLLLRPIPSVLLLLMLLLLPQPRLLEPMLPFELALFPFLLLLKSLLIDPVAAVPTFCCCCS